MFNIQSALCNATLQFDEIEIGVWLVQILPGSVNMAMNSFVYCTIRYIRSIIYDGF